MGQVMSHYWFPVLLTDELSVPDGPPKRVRLLGRDLVAFRDTRGAVGLLDEKCSHRGASLVLGRNENCGLRCIYHGWKYDVTGQVLEVPTEPSAGSERLRASVTHPAYVTHEAGGIIWAYVGEDLPAPVPPLTEWTSMDSDQLVITKVRQRCNWLQAIEGAIDPAHLSFLHHDAFASNMSLVATAGDEVTVKYHDTEYGFLMGIIRDPEAQPERYQHVVANPLVLPSTVLTSLNDDRGTSGIFVPVDDENTFVYTVTYGRGGPIDRDGVIRMRGMRPGIDVNQDYESARTVDNQWLQDRGAMDRGESYSGLGGLTLEDVAIGESQGPIRSRERERLGPADIAIAHLRHVLFETLDQVAGGEAPRGSRAGANLSEVRSRSGLLERSRSWVEVVDPAAEPAQQRI
jgi:phthalate 4,5-dioxygenase oxygenase subunit